MLIHIRYGVCVPYQARTEMPNPCDSLYESGVDYVYVPWVRGERNYRELMKILFRSGPTFQSTFQDCKEFESTMHLLCQFYLPPCGNSTHFEPPAAVCPSACRVPSLACPDEWARILTAYEVASTLLSEIAYFINCSDTGVHLHPIPHCCHNVGINTSKLYYT